MTSSLTPRSAGSGSSGNDEEPISDPSDITLNPSSAVVLGLLATGGPQTTYEMLSYITTSIGYFWPFPMSQMYSESKRLETAGLVSGTQEHSGRRRRQLSITPAGQAALTTWLRHPTDRATEIRDVGLLKLFFMDTASDVAIEELAAEQERTHAARLAEYQAIAETLTGQRPMAERTIELGLAFERIAIEFWQGVQRNG